jgi:hypothetical protein
VDGAYLIRLIGEDTCGPQGVAQVVTARLELGGEAAVDDARAAVGGQM